MAQWNSTSETQGMAGDCEASGFVNSAFNFMLDLLSHMNGKDKQ